MRVSQSETGAMFSRSEITKKLVPLHRIYLPFISQMEDCCFLYILYISINIYSVDIIVSIDNYYCLCLASSLF